MRKLLLFTMFIGLNVHAAVNARYVRIEAPASSRMGLYEVEVWSGGANVALKNKEMKYFGFGYQGRDINLGNDGRSLTDGIIDREKRPVESGIGVAAGGLNPWLEIDFGREQAMDRLVIHSLLKRSYDDRGIRLVSVLDANRRVLWTASYDILKEPFSIGVAAFDLAPGKGPLIGRELPPNAGAWAPLGDVLEASPATLPKNAEVRAARFQARNSPAAIEQLAKEFFARIDLSKPELAGVKQQFERQEYSVALDAYRDHFLRKLQGIAFANEQPAGSYGVRTSPLMAEDLQRNIAVVLSRFEVVASRFTPGTIDWVNVRANDPISLELAISRVRAGLLSWPLLQTYRETGRPEFLAHWAAINDDWGMNIRTDLDRAAAQGQSLRNYFVKTEQQLLNHLFDLLGQTAKERPEFVRLLPGATLARLLIPVLEEYPPAYWWVCRRASFNHTYNALNAATTLSRVLDDFYAGERLDRENRQHWERIWSQTITRDGSMNEVSDEGHWLMHWRINPTLNQMKKTPPPWYTPEFAAEAQTGWEAMATYAIRWLAPGGKGHVSSNIPLVSQFWDIGERRLTYGGMMPREMLDSSALLRIPEVATILQASFGSGRNRSSLSPDEQNYYDKITAYYGKEHRPPQTASDWTPYSGLYYLRESWQPDALFCHMRSQPTGHPSTGDERFGTWFDLRQGSEPLVRVLGASIDGLPQFPAAGKQTYQPGSKTDQLATASEDPVPARWHSSKRFDYAEAFYEGTYQNCKLKTQRFLELDDSSLELGDKLDGVRTQRSLLFVRPARLFIATDAIHVPGPAQPHRYDFGYSFAPSAVLPPKTKETKKANPEEILAGDASCTRLTHEQGSGLTLRRFSAAKMTWHQLKQPALDAPGNLQVNSSGDLLMSTLLEPHRQGGDVRVKAATDLSDAGRTGFRAELTDSAVLTWLATGSEPGALKAGNLELQAESLMLYEQVSGNGNQLSVISGVALGCTRLSVGGKAVEFPCPDFEFSLNNDERISNIQHRTSNNELKSKSENSPITDNRSLITSFIPIHRPIQPIRFSPAEEVFTDTQTVKLTSGTPGVEIRYTLDGKEPQPDSPLYTQPLTLTKDTFIRARAFRPGVKEIPFTADGTQVTVVSSAQFKKRTLWPAVSPAGKLVPGLSWELVGGNCFSLFSHLNLPAVMPAAARGETTKMLDVSMRQGEGPFGVRYSGLINIPADGVWTFHAPQEYVGASCEPGYDLRIWIDGEEWDLGMRLHGLGLWSVPLAKGPHRLLVTFADARSRDRTVHNSQLWRSYPRPWVVWKGEAPVIDISGPGVNRQPLPTAWLVH